jgi:hypothetical protein
VAQLRTGPTEVVRRNALQACSLAAGRVIIHKSWGGSAEGLCEP